MAALAAGGFLLLSQKGQATAPAIAPPADLIPPRNTNFPLNVGSRGEKVRQLQRGLQAFNTTAANHINSTGGADGIFGAGTLRAVQAAGYAAPVSQTIYNRIITGTPPAGQSVALPAPAQEQPTGKHLLADSWSGAAVMTGPGTGKRISVSNNTYLGKATGKRSGLYHEFITGITIGTEGQAQYKAWVSSLQSTTVTAEELPGYMKLTGKEKSPDVVQWFINNAQKA